MTDAQPPILSQSEPIVDRYRRVTPKWYPWFKKLFDTLRRVDSDLSGITATYGEVSSTVNGIVLDVATLTDTTVDQGLAISQTQTLTNTLDTNLTALDGTVSALSANWTVRISAGNQVIGMVKLDGSATESAFTVVADKFLVSNPTSTGETIQAFVVGTVDAVTTVGINGNLIVDNTILARHLDVESLSSITADIGTVTAGKMQSADGNMVIDLDAKTIVITA